MTDELVPPRPIENCYWVVPSRFLAGEYPRTLYEDSSRRKLAALLDAGVTCFIDLTGPEDGLEPYAELVRELSQGQASVHRFSVPDVSVPGSRQTTTRILDKVDEVIEQDGLVYLHCWGGVGRTGTLVGCWLARHGYRGRAALDRLQELWRQCPKSRRRRSPETKEQEVYVVNWNDEARMETRGRYLGCLLGLAVGDAVGTTLEFKAPGSFEPLTDMVGGGPFGLKPGQWTDDTSMALCLAESLIERQGFDPVDQLTRYVRWWREGHLSSTGTCFDIGGTCATALRRFEETGQPDCGPTDPYSAGNGSLMRLAPVPMFYAADPQEAIRKSGESSRTTHGATEAVDACRYFGGLLVGALRGVAKETLLADHYAPAAGVWLTQPLTPNIAEIAAGSFKRRNPPEIKGSGYVVKSLEAALWAFHRTDCFRDGCLKAANLGDDADTTCAVYGQLAGAFYGLEGIPTGWVEQVALREVIEEFAERLHDLSGL